jgi:hypothetical protein
VKSLIGGDFQRSANYDSATVVHSPNKYLASPLGYPQKRLRTKLAMVVRRQCSSAPLQGDCYIRACHTRAKLMRPAQSSKECLVVLTVYLTVGRRSNGYSTAQAWRVAEVFRFHS